MFHKGIFKHSNFGEHPLFVQLLKENKSIQNHLSLIKPFYKRGEILNHKKELKTIFNKCNDFELKFNKYENIIFSYLEKRVPSTKPFGFLSRRTFLLQEIFQGLICSKSLKISLFILSSIVSLLVLLK